MYLVGGKADCETQYCDMYRLDTASGTWEHVPATGDHPPPCFSHTLTAVDNHRLLLVGGCPASDNSVLYLFDSRTACWRREPLQSSPEFVPVRHSATLVGDSLYLIGGGAFNFGTVFGRPFRLPWPGALA